MLTVLFISAIFLAYSNGANDNFKGVATLYGSGIVDYKTAITIATITTFLGSIAAIFVAQGLIASFSGKGLVPQDVAGTAHFLMAVGFGAGCTVMLATRIGLPISTTHSLVGALVGAGLMSVGLNVNFQNLGNAFFLPLIASPFIAFIFGAIVYGFFNRLRLALKLSKEACICVGKERKLIPVGTLSRHANNSINLEAGELTANTPTVHIGNTSQCFELYTGKIWRISVQKTLDAAHIVSAAAVSFARRLNDTPKIAGLLVTTQALNIQWGMIAIALGMAIGGLLNARRVAETMSNKITEINHGQGFSANLVTSFLVIVASKFGVPVSTTHVSVGSIFGIGIVSGKRDNKVIRRILLSWLFTLPVAMAFSALIYWLL